MTDRERLAEYDRWLASPSPSAIAFRWMMGATGQWAVNTPLMKLHQHLMMQPKHRWLDIGSGRGALLRFIDSRVGFQRAPVGLDGSRELLRIARDDQRGAEHIAALTQGTATTLPFRDESFDFVTCGHLVKHLTDAELDTFLLEVRRVLVGGGLAVIWDFAPTGGERLDRWNRFVLSTGVHDLQLRGTRDLMQHATANGYELVRDARLRPFIVPPIPRASIFIGKAPEGWHGPDNDPHETNTDD